MKKEGESAVDAEVIVVGAGPVGLLLANLLASSGIRALVLERRLTPRDHSQAIGITPPSLEILAKIGLDEAFIRGGVPIHDVHVHGECGRLGCCSFRRIPGRHPFVLSLPQRDNVALLEERLGTLPTARLQRGVEAVGVKQGSGSVEVLTHEGSVTARFVVACDGHRSRIRDLLAIQVAERTYRCHFLMGDFLDESNMGSDAHVFFTADGAVEAFPLPGGFRRWIVQTGHPVVEGGWGRIPELVWRRTGLHLAASAQTNQTWFTPKRLDCASLYKGRVILCGDAAHVMSPIGGQGMNVGFGDASLLAALLVELLSAGGDPSLLLASYERCRRQAARTAANRAAAGMWIGTRTGGAESILRDWVIGEILLQAMGELVPKHYAMMC